MSSTGRPAETIGVIGAGTMGSGIAQLAALSGARTLLHDCDPGALAAARERIEAHLRRGVNRGRLTEEEVIGALERLDDAPTSLALAPSQLVIEAAPESLELKQELLGHLSREVVGPECVLATNTSSLLVTAVASACERPERVLGMHFFNPAPVMALLEIVAGDQTAATALALARATGEAMGKHVIDAADGPGFLVNRCNRPFGLEALRLLTERIAPVEQIDRICRLGGGFPMGPFEVMDLVGVDVGLDVARSFYAQSFGEPRWRPSPIAVQMVAAGRLGRKCGRGYYAYADGRHRPADRSPPAPGGGDGLVVVAGESTLALELVQAAADAGWDVAAPEQAEGQVPALILDLTGAEGSEFPLQGAPQAILCAAGSLGALDPGGGSVGFHVLPPLEASRCVEMTRGRETSGAAANAAERFFATLGKHVEWVGDGPGLVLGRIVAQVVNEAAFALGEGVGSSADIDAGMIHGLGYPRGILAWADVIGLDWTLTVLEALFEERREERYRPAPALSSLALSGRLGIHTGEGFFTYDPMDGADSDIRPAP